MFVCLCTPVVFNDPDKKIKAQFSNRVVYHDRYIDNTQPT